jgi:tetratricopeptide (TPR) repeat protein
VVAILFAGAVQAGDYEDGKAAYERRDYTTALTKFRSAAQQGDAGAQNILGVMYANGQGVALDYKEAVRWFQISAQQGDANAQNNLGNKYFNGQGVAQDHKEAVRWFQLAATQGNAPAQFNLGFMFERGQGVAQDYKEAVRWFKLAAAQGDENAKRSLEIAERKASETLAIAANSNANPQNVGARFSKGILGKIYSCKLNKEIHKDATGIVIKFDLSQNAFWTFGGRTVNNIAFDEKSQSWIAQLYENTGENKYSIVFKSGSMTMVDKDGRVRSVLLCEEDLPRVAENRREVERKTHERTISTLNVDTKRTNIEEVDRLKILLITEISDEVMNEAIYADRSWLATGQINDQKVTFQRGGQLHEN